MRSPGSLALLLATALVTWACAASAPPAAPRGATRVQFDTEAGSFVVELDDRAPGTVANFLRYVDGGFYDGGRFHRTVTTQPDNQPDNTVKIDVIQAGADPERESRSFAPIALERTAATGLRHVDGVISMARDGPDSATSDFFLCVGAQPELDFGGRRNPDGEGFAAFGRVVEGMAAVHRIHRSPAAGQTLSPPVAIHSARRLP
jgi:peptidyl-prolyl cis-trans isomerase A (cyclophilin A)